jgi:lysophospholipase L1-like esterase
MTRSSAFKVFADSFVVARTISKDRGLRHGVSYFVSARGKGLLRALFDSCSTAYARLTGRPLVHVIGDSHAKVFRWHRPFIVHHVGAATAHNLPKTGSTTSSNRKLFDAASRVGPNDVAVLVFGEIDCRIHIYYQFKKNGERTPIGELIDGTVANYGEVMDRLAGLGIRFAVCGVPPATRVRNEYRYPFYAPPEVHCRINALFNERLKALCDRKGYPYIDVHSRFADEDGFMRRDYAADEIHLNGRTVDHVRKELRRGLSVPA